MIKSISKINLFGGIKPLKAVELILKYKKSGGVLDLGAGDWRNSVFLAKSGFDVISVGSKKIK